MIKKQLVYTTISLSLAANIVISQSEDINKLLEKIDKLLQIKYTDPREGNVYEIRAGEELINNTFDLNLKIEKYIIDNKILNIQIIDKGHKIDGQNILSKDYSRYDRYETSFDLYEIYENHSNEKPIKYIELLDENNISTNNPDNVQKVVITLLNESKLIINKGDDKLNFSRYIDKNNNIVDLTNIDINTTEGLSVAKAVVGFEKQKELGYLKEFDIPSKIIGNYKIACNTLTINRNLDSFYTGAYMPEGKELINSLANRVFYKNGNKYFINYDFINSNNDEDKCKNNVTKIVHNDGIYSFDIKFNIKKDISLFLEGNQNFKLTIKSNIQPKLNNFRNKVIDAIVNQNSDISSSKFDILAGNTRFETAIEVSKEYTKINGANGVVIVGQDAIIDGLSAAPFAKYRNSPILLTQKDEVPRNVIDEIKRIFRSYTGIDTIYLIGGQNVISDNVFEQLVSEIKNVKIVRISGKDRYETSINISKKMDLESTNNAYIVGGFGEADAMSVAPLASNQGAPIIVSKQENLSESDKEIIKYNENIIDINIIGGVNKVSTQVMKDIKESADNRKNNNDIVLKRISGKDRKETNANVLRLFNNNDVSNIVISKDGMTGSSYLIDSLTAATLGYPIILSTDNISKSQKDFMENINSNSNLNKLIQVGYGISSKVIDSILNIIK